MRIPAYTIFFLIRRILYYILNRRHKTEHKRPDNIQKGIQLFLRGMITDEMTIFGVFFLLLSMVCNNENVQLLWIENLFNSKPSVNIVQYNVYTRTLYIEWMDLYNVNSHSINPLCYQIINKVQLMERHHFNLLQTYQQ